MNGLTRGPGLRSGQLLLAALALALATGGCAASSKPANAPARDSRSPVDELASYDLALSFDGPWAIDDAVPTAANVGRVPVSVKVTTSSGGLLTWAEGAAHGADRAVRTPISSPSGALPAAALVVTPAPGSEGELDPGDREVLLGADFRIDPPQDRGPEDNGDNLFQRGRDGEKAMVKLQVDHGVPSCRIVGADADVVVKADGPVVPGRWYRMTCERAGGEVRLTLLDVTAPSAKPREWAAARDPGSIRFGDVPFSIGAKVSSRGTIDSSSVDQFNGLIDRVVLDVR